VKSNNFAARTLQA